jgi:large subunit ribosomal protein L22
MQAMARASYVRISPRRVDQLFMLVRGKSVSRALATLRLVTKGSRPLVEKLILSALANAGKQASPDTWHIHQAWVGYGPVMKRMRAHAMGRGATIRHPTAHLTVILSDERGKSKSEAN